MWGKNVEIPQHVKKESPYFHPTFPSMCTAVLYFACYMLLTVPKSVIVYTPKRNIIIFIFSYGILYIVYTSMIGLYYKC